MRTFRSCAPAAPGVGTAAIDAGTVVNPGHVTAQVEGGTIYGLSNALYGAITANKVDGRLAHLMESGARSV